MKTTGGSREAAFFKARRTRELRKRGEGFTFEDGDDDSPIDDWDGTIIDSEVESKPTIERILRAKMDPT